MVDFGPKDKERENMDEDAKKSDEDKAAEADVAEDDEVEVIFTDWAAF